VSCLITNITDTGTERFGRATGGSDGVRRMRSGCRCVTVYDGNRLRACGECQSQEVCGFPDNPAAAAGR